MKLAVNLILLLIKEYKYTISPLLGFNCRYLPTCSEYFADCVETHGSFKGLFLGVKRILTCHPIKFLGGGSGFNPAPKLKQKK